MFISLKYRRCLSLLVLVLSTLTVAPVLSVGAEEAVNELSGSSPASIRYQGRAISGITVEPDGAISIEEMKSVFGLSTGMNFSRKELKEVIKLLYLTGRFSDIKVDARGVNEDVELSFIFEMKERVGEITVTGNKAIAGRHIEDVITISKLDEMSIRAVDRQISDIKELYSKKGYFQCQVEYLLVRHPESGTVDIEFKIMDEGSRSSVSRIIFKGNTLFSDEELLKRLKVGKDRMYEEYDIETGIKSLEKLYRRGGYQEVKAGFQTTLEPDGSGVVLTINIVEGEKEGRKIRIDSTTFKGNEAFSSKSLRDQMNTKNTMSEEILAKDLQAIEYFYRKNGYLSAMITEKDLVYNEDGSRLKIELTVTEGPRTILGEVVFTGNRQFRQDELLEVTTINTGMPLDPWAVEDSAAKILSFYFQKGHIYARVSHATDFTEDGTSAVVRFMIDEGIPVKVGRIVISGNDFTDDEVIRRELLVKPGDVYNQELVYRSQQRVSRLGFLGGVRLTPVDQEIVEGEKDLLLSVRERKAGALEFGFGYGSEEHFRGFAELSHRNIYGTGASARARGDLSELDQSFIVEVKKPWFMEYDVDGRFSLIDQTTKRESYSLRKYAAVVGLDKDLTDLIKGSLQYEYELNRPFDVEEGAVISSEDEEDLDIGTISPISIRDSRDNLFNPKRGSLNSVKIDYSAGMSTGSEVEFMRYILQSSWYLSLSENVVWALSARGGWADAFGDTKEIPISKRFFLGGRTTVRGFELESIGPKGDDGTPTGGDAYLNLNTELRFPLIGRRFGGLLFVDAGNVWLKNAETVNPFDLRSSAGTGVRYLTPVGPLSLDIGWKLDREDGESAWEWHFTVGNVF